MKVSQSFLRDFAYHANLYKWDAADIEDVKAQTRANPDAMRRYWTTLAAAHRAGYVQTAENGYERLGMWMAHNKAFADQYARARERINARIAPAREDGHAKSDQYAFAREAPASPLWWPE